MHTSLSKSATRSNSIGRISTPSSPTSRTTPPVHARASASPPMLRRSPDPVQVTTPVLVSHRVSSSPELLARPRPSGMNCLNCYICLSLLIFCSLLSSRGGSSGSGAAAHKSSPSRTHCSPRASSSPIWYQWSFSCLTNHAAFQHIQVTSHSSMRQSGHQPVRAPHFDLTGTPFAYTQQAHIASETQQQQLAASPNISKV